MFYVNGTIIITNKIIIVLGTTSLRISIEFCYVKNILKN